MERVELYGVISRLYNRPESFNLIVYTSIEKAIKAARIEWEKDGVTLDFSEFEYGIDGIPILGSPILVKQNGKDVGELYIHRIGIDIATQFGGTVIAV